MDSIKINITLKNNEFIDVALENKVLIGEKHKITITDNTIKDNENIIDTKISDITYLNYLEITNANILINVNKIQEKFKDDIMNPPQRTIHPSTEAPPPTPLQYQVNLKNYLENDFYNTNILVKSFLGDIETDENCLDITHRIDIGMIDINIENEEKKGEKNNPKMYYIKLINNYVLVKLAETNQTFRESIKSYFENMPLPTEITELVPMTYPILPMEVIQRILLDENYGSVSTYRAIYGKIFKESFFKYTNEQRLLLEKREIDLILNAPDLKLDLKEEKLYKQKQEEFIKIIYALANILYNFNYEKKSVMKTFISIEIIVKTFNNIDILKISSAYKDVIYPITFYRPEPIMFRYIFYTDKLPQIMQILTQIINTDNFKLFSDARNINLNISYKYKLPLLNTVFIKSFNLNHSKESSQYTDLMTKILEQFKSNQASKQLEQNKLKLKLKNKVFEESLLFMNPVFVDPKPIDIQNIIESYKAKISKFLDQKLYEQLSFFNEFLEKRNNGKYTFRNFFELKLFQFISSVSIHNNDYDQALIEGIIVNEELSYKDKYILLNFFDTDDTILSTPPKKPTYTDLNTLFIAYSQKIITLLNKYSKSDESIDIKISFNRGEHENENGNEDSIEIILNKNTISFAFSFVKYHFEFNSEQKLIEYFKSPDFDNPLDETQLPNLYSNIFNSLKILLNLKYEFDKIKINNYSSDDIEFILSVNRKPYTKYEYEDSKFLYELEMTFKRFFSLYLYLLTEINPDLEKVSAGGKMKKKRRHLKLL